MKNLGILALAAMAVLVLGVASLGTRSAQAAVTDTRAVWCGFLASPPSDLTIGEACDGNISSTDVQTLADSLGDTDGELTADDLDDIDLDANQITDGGAFPLDTIEVFAFVDDDEIVTFDADAGVTVAVNNDGEAIGVNDADAETCDAGDDLDCDNSTSSSDDGDGVAVATITEESGSVGDEIDVNVSQADDPSAESTQTLLVVGDADNIAVSEVAGKATVQTDAGDCADEADVTDGSQIADVDKTFVQGVVTDNDDTPLTRIGVEWDVSDTDISTIESDTLVSVDAGDVGIAAFAVVCGGDTTGVNTITGTDDADNDDDVDITTVGEPATVTLTASPAAILCNGTTSSTVTATVVDSEGNNVAGGTNVNFSVVALGTANPINFATVNGQASSQITPLSGNISGVTVVVTAGDAEASILVACNTPPVIATAIATIIAGSPTPPGGVTPPDTGTGGYLGQDSSGGFPMWILAALAMGAVALVAGGAIARRSAK